MPSVTVALFSMSHLTYSPTSLLPCYSIPTSSTSLTLFYCYLPPAPFPTTCHASFYFTAGKHAAVFLLLFDILHLTCVACGAFCIAWHVPFCLFPLFTSFCPFCLLPFLFCSALTAHCTAYHAAACHLYLPTFLLCPAAPALHLPTPPLLHSSYACSCLPPPLAPTVACVHARALLLLLLLSFSEDRTGQG